MGRKYWVTSARNVEVHQNIKPENKCLLPCLHHCPLEPINTWGSCKALDSENDADGTSEDYTQMLVRLFVQSERAANEKT